MIRTLLSSMVRISSTASRKKLLGNLLFLSWKIRRSCSPQRSSGDDRYLEGNLQAEQYRLAGSEGAQFSLKAQSSGYTSHDAEEIQMWPPSPSQPQGRPVETLPKRTSMSACGSVSQQEESWLAKHTEGGLGK